DPTQAEIAVHRAGAPATAAAGVRANLELRLRLLLVDQCLLRHLCGSLTTPSVASLCPHDRLHPCPSRRNGKPSARRSARPWSSVCAVVTIVTFMPRTVSILS